MTEFCPQWEDLESIDMEFVLHTFDSTQLPLNDGGVLADFGGHSDLSENALPPMGFEDSLFGYLSRNQ